MSETTFNQIDSLPENMQLKYYRAVCDYGLNGIEPNFKGVEKSVFIPMRDLIDYSNDRSRINADNGRKGGAPEGNQNRKQAKSTDLNLFQPTSTEIMQEAKGHGFFIEPKTAKSFLECGLDPLWLSPPHTFIEFVAERIKGKYIDKPLEDIKAMFIAAVLSKDEAWDDLRQEYPAWKSKREKKNRNTVIETARENPPTNCRCGGRLTHHGDNELYCYECRDVTHRFDEASAEWIYEDRRIANAIR